MTREEMTVKAQQLVQMLVQDWIENKRTGQIIVSYEDGQILNIKPRAHLGNENPPEYELSDWIKYRRSGQIVVSLVDGSIIGTNANEHIGMSTIAIIQ